MGLAAGWNTGVVAVSTLRILAAGLKRRVPVLACIRARKDEVFAAAFESGDWDSGVLLEPGVYRIQSVLEAIGDIQGLTAVGNGQRSMNLPEGISGTGEELDQPRPSLTAVLARQMHVVRGFDEAPAPVYLRGFNQKAKNIVP
jgi:tRNA A37 threonylcarbamoyladenosine modification protein TsaB